MLELITLLLFTAILLGCVVFGIPILIALGAGFVIFISYALYKRFTLKQITAMVWSGISQAKTILIIFLLIGMLTALWRCGGTIAYIIYNSIQLINPNYFIVFTFLLCCLVSYLTGTSFGSVSTMGVICMTMGRTLGISTFMMGGAILSGVYYGDRFSPMSSSALLVASITGTDIYRNLKIMLRTSIVPFIITVAVYAVTGYTRRAGTLDISSLGIFSESFQLSWLVIIPVAIIIILSLFKLDIRIVMSGSITASIVICLCVQNMSAIEILRCLIFGFHPESSQLSALMSGGGIISMVQTAAIVALSSAYFGIFRNTHLLDKVKDLSFKLDKHSTNFITVLTVSVITVVISCSQTLAAMLSCEITGGYIDDKEELASYLENSAIIICPLIPWSIASTFPIAAIGAPANCMLYAVYLYALPVWGIFVSLYKKFHNQKNKNKKGHIC